MAKTKREQIKEAAENDLITFINLVHPKTELGQIHKDIIRWWTRQGGLSHQVLLLPRDHQKSRLVAYRVAWAITRDPAIRILYISSTSNLATKQLKFIKDILTSDIYRYYWPEMVNDDESKREKWTEREIAVDHPKRREEAVRDPTVFTAGLTTGIVGMHCDVSVFDDVVVFDNAYTEDGRSKVLDQYSLLASIEGAEAQQWVVGTHYHPKDLYMTMKQTYVDSYDENGNIEGQSPLYEVYEKVVETSPGRDGTGQFLWPRQQRPDGQWFGFNREILARKRAQYQNKTQFYAQYYNDPNDTTEAPIKREWFQYYERGLLGKTPVGWSFKGRRLNVFAAIDFAYTLSKESDYTAIAVVGVDAAQNYYVLDLVRLKTKLISDYFKEIFALHTKWGFRKLRAEVTSGQSVIVEDLKTNYIRPYGLALSIDEHKPTSRSGSKEERIMSALQPRYANQQVWHYPDGNCIPLEEELVLQNPPHDDLKDALASCIEVCVAPTINRSAGVEREKFKPLYHPRFGGIGLH